MMTLIRLLGRLALLVCLLVGVAWALGAFWYDFPIAAAKHGSAYAFALVALLLLVLVRPWWRGFATVAACVFLVLCWWLTLRPSNDRDWQPDVARTAYAETNGDVVTIHNVRNCDYRTEFDYTPIWETRVVRLSKLTGADIAIDYWGSAWIAHPIVSFQFADAPAVCFSIETRKTKGESYSAIGGLYRQFELIYIAADERDVFRVRTNYRHGEDLYLYRLALSRERALQRFHEYLRSLNALHERPRWYNAATTNCTTSIRAQHPAAERPPWDWRLLLNGKGDELMYERRSMITGGLPFAKLRAQALINRAAKAADSSPEFSKLIREGRVGL